MNQGSNALGNQHAARHLVQSCEFLISRVKIEVDRLLCKLPENRETMAMFICSGDDWIISPANEPEVFLGLFAELEEDHSYVITLAEMDRTGLSDEKARWVYGADENPMLTPEESRVNLFAIRINAPNGHRFCLEYASNKPHSRRSEIIRRAFVGHYKTQFGEGWF